MSEKTVSGLVEEKDGFFQDKIVANAPTIIGVFANIVVIISDYRAYEVVFQLTGSWWKALSASLACAIPFILWEIGWQYNHTTDNWRKASLFMAGLAFATSIFLGIADYLKFTGEWTDTLLSGVVVLIGIHTVVAFLYYYNDPDVARRRYKAQTYGKMKDQRLNATVTQQILEDGKEVLGTIKKLEDQYGEEEVARILAILQGKKYATKN